MRLLWLPEVLRAAGLTVHEVSGWRERGSDTFDPKGLICHATAGSRTSTDAGEIRVLLTGSKTAPPPIAQLYLGRNGHWHVVASGRCNHALKGWGGPLEGLSNTNLIGVEAANDNKGEPWPAVQLDSYQRGVAAICRRMKWSANRVAGHKEHQPYPPPKGQTSTKSDPHGVDMGKFRARVAALLAGKDDDVSAAEVWSTRWMGVDKEYPASTWLINANKYAAEAMAEARAVRQGIEALLAAQQGLDTERVLARIDKHAADERARDEQAGRERAELLELVRRAQAGEVDARAVVDEIGARLTGRA